MKDGVLSGFTASSFALIDSVLPVDKTPLEAVMEFETAEEVLETFGLMGGVGKGFGFTPFYVANSKVTGCLSSTGKTWDIANGFDTGILLRPKSIYRMRCIWDGVSFSWYVWQGKWVELRTLR